MKIYTYDVQTKEFLEELEINEAYGTNLPFTTTVKPLAKKDGFVICFDGTKWEYIEDNRDTELYHGKEKYEIGSNVNGKSYDGIGDIPEWLSTEPEPDTPEEIAEQLADTARAKRDSLLTSLEPQLLRYERQERLGVETTDTEAWYLAALQYAQDLRDLPQQAGFPESVEWPEVPETLKKVSEEYNEEDE